jgi:NAD-reducing hydrogenase large subunit
MALVGPDGEVEHYDGRLRVVDAEGNRLADDIDPRPYWEYVGEAVESWSYLKSAYWRDLGYPDGCTGSARSPASTWPTGWERREPTTR